MQSTELEARKARSTSDLVVPEGATAVVTLPKTLTAPETLSFVKFERGSIIRNILTRVHLSPNQSDGDVYSMPGKASKVLTAQAYQHLNKFTGLSYITPETIVDQNGDRVQNPYLVRKRGVEDISYIRCRKIGIVRNAVGNLVALDLTVTYDLDLYGSQDLFSKWKRGASSKSKKDGNSEAAKPKQWGKLVASTRTDTKHFDNQLVVNMYSGQSLIVDLDCIEVIDWTGEQLRRQLFAERNVHTIVERNIAKKLYAVSALPADNMIPVVGWQQTDRDLLKLAEIVEQANEGHHELGDDKIPIQVQRPREEIVTEEDVNASIECDAEQKSHDDEEQPTRRDVVPDGASEFDEIVHKIESSRKERLFNDLGAAGLDYEHREDWTPGDWLKALSLAQRTLFEQLQEQNAKSEKESEQS